MNNPFHNALQGEVKIPGLGPVKKKILIPIVVAAGAFVAYRYYVARSSVGGDATTAAADATDDGFDTDGTVPDTLDSVPASGLFGSTDGEDTTTASTVDSFGFTGTTNDQWTQYAATQLEASDTWSYTDIVTALGAYLAGSPLSAVQQQIVQAAIAVAGQPPVGTHVLVPGGASTGTTAVTAPTGLAVTTTATTANLTFQPVAGAEGYRAYDNKSSTNVSSSVGANITVGQLLPNTTYIFHVRALSSSGALGPSSSTVTAKTLASSSTSSGSGSSSGSTTAAKVPPAPGGFSVTTTATTATLKCSAVAGATQYRAYDSVSATNIGAASGPSVTVGGLKKNTSYKFHMRAFNAKGEGAASKTITIKTKS